MTPSKQARRLGLKSLIQVSELSGVPIATLNDWVKTRPVLFETVLLGCVKKLELITN